MLPQGGFQFSRPCGAEAMFGEETRFTRGAEYRVG